VSFHDDLQSTRWPVPSHSREKEEKKGGEEEGGKKTKKKQGTEVEGRANRETFKMKPMRTKGLRLSEVEKKKKKKKERGKRKAKVEGSQRMLSPRERGGGGGERGEQQEDVGLFPGRDPLIKKRRK